ncbi:hypothetical protein AB0C28_02725 [Nonomuraea sp. NPDC048892]|uniref:hypothetical protein n=1 Tax=Nonomuraea sp. NPDC048892 TaxID=3154624 RepID=UPI0033C62ECD
MEPDVRIYGSPQAAFVNSTFHGQFVFTGKWIQPRRLSQQDIKRMRAVYVKPQENIFSRAVAAARETGAVVLCAEPGTGRRITAVNVAIELDATPEWLTLDEENVHASLYVEQRRAYLLNLRDTGSNLIPLVGKEVPDYVARLREAGSYLIVLATVEERKALDLVSDLAIVKLEASDPRQVFTAYLTKRHGYPQEHAEQWETHNRIADVLISTSPASAVSLAEDVHESGHREPEDSAVEEVLAAFWNWEKQLKDWFSSTVKPEDGYKRALLLSVAALEGAPPAEVFDAADQLCEATGTPYLPGRGLVGPGIAQHLDDVGARRDEEGLVHFTRHRYGTAVLDHVWKDRPFFQKQLVTWISDLPEARPAEVIFDLAVRYGQPELVLDTVQKWAADSVDRSALLLTAAAMSDKLGPAVRGKMYAWARQTGQEALQLVVAEVCGGHMADEFDRVALTRLRNLVRFGTERVRAAVVTAMLKLAGRPRLRARVLSEIGEWVAGVEPARTTGLRTFVALAGTRLDDGRLLLLPASTRDETLIDLIASGWRLSLRDPEIASEAKNAVVVWLEDAIRGTADADVVRAVLLAACRSSVDTGMFVRLVWHWAYSTSRDDLDREGFCVELSRQIGQRDPLTPGITPLSEYSRQEVPTWDIEDG